MRDNIDPKAFATKSSITLSQAQTTSDQVTTSNYIPEKFIQGSKKGANKESKQRGKKSNASSKSRGKNNAHRSASPETSDNTLLLK